MNSINKEKETEKMNDTKKFNVGDLVWRAEEVNDEGIFCFQTKIEKICHVYDGTDFKFLGYICTGCKNEEISRPTSVFGTKEELKGFLDENIIDDWRRINEEKKSEGSKKSKRDITIVAGKVQGDSKISEAVENLFDVLGKGGKDE